MADEEISDAFNATGSAYTKCSAEMFKHEEIEQENLHGWDAAAWIIYYLEFYLFVLFTWHYCDWSILYVLIFIFTEAPISEETDVKDEPLHRSSEYDQVNYGVQVSSGRIHGNTMLRMFLRMVDICEIV